MNCQWHPFWSMGDHSEDVRSWFSKNWTTKRFVSVTRKFTRKVSKFFGKIQIEEITACCIRSYLHVYTLSFIKNKVIQSSVITRLNYSPYWKRESCTTTTIPMPTCLICLHTTSTSTSSITTCSLTITTSSYTMPTSPMSSYTKTTSIMIYSTISIVTIASILYTLFA